MGDRAYRQTELQKDKMKIIVQYPEAFGEDERINAEIRAILFSILDEHMRKNFNRQKEDCFGSKEGSLSS